MRKLLFLILAVLLALPAIGYAAVFVMSERNLRDFERPTPFMYVFETDSGTIERGRHIARTRGCLGCHGHELEGSVYSEWGANRLVAPNLAAYARDNDAITLEAALRHGVGRDGRALLAMPSYNFGHLSDQDVGSLISFLRSAQVVDNDLPRTRLALVGRLAIVMGKWKHMADMALELPPLISDPTEDPSLARGEYLAMTTCNECHGLDLRGTQSPDFTTPDLAIVAAYSGDEFRTLMSQGVGSGGHTDLGLMSVIARERFGHFSEQELTDLYGFLASLPDRPVAEGVSWRLAP
jgi:mono/diheme cytochrome c family protein